MNPLDVKRKALQAVKVFGKEGMAGHLKGGYGKKPAIAISIESTKVEPEEMEGEHMMPDGKMMKDSEMVEPKAGLASLAGADAAEEMAEDKAEGEMPGEITPELLEMLLSKMKRG
jgi:hypothetical protein